MKDIRKNIAFGWLIFLSGLFTLGAILFLIQMFKLFPWSVIIGVCVIFFTHSVNWAIRVLEE